MHLTPTEIRMMHLLGDGRVHTNDELMGCLNDHLTDRKTLKVTFGNLNKKLNQQGRHIKSIQISRYVFGRQLVQLQPLGQNRE